MSSDRFLAGQGLGPRPEENPFLVGIDGQSCRRSGRGIPALLDWIDEAEAVNRVPAAILSIAVLISAFALLLAVRLGWLPS